MSERFPEPGIVEDVGSSLNFTGPGLRPLMERAMCGDKFRVVTAHRDRLGNFQNETDSRTAGRSWVGCVRFVFNRSVEYLKQPETKANWKVI